MKSPSAAPTAELIERLAAIVGPAHALTDRDAQLSHLREWRGLYVGRAAIALKPGSVQELSRILALAHAHAFPVVPQGGNTGLVGGQTPMHGEILLCLSRLTHVRAVDAAGYTMNARGRTDPGRGAGRRRASRPPLSPEPALRGQLPDRRQPRDQCRRCRRARLWAARQLVLGPEVVLADGRVWSGLKALNKDNSGHDLKDLFIGSERTLGVITAAVLKLFPKPAEKATAFVALGALNDALALFHMAFEFMPRIALDFVRKHVAGTREPFAVTHPWYVLLETSGLKADGTAERLLSDVLEQAGEAGILDDAALARSLAQARDFWRLRDSFSLAQKGEGGNIKNDISVPIAAIPDFVARAEARVVDLCPGARPLAVGHFGDGNVHYNIAQPIGMPKAEFLARWEELAHAVAEVALAFGGFFRRTRQWTDEAAGAGTRQAGG
jgi:FAD/FMN-containing dehydrogenase